MKTKFILLFFLLFTIVSNINANNKIIDINSIINNASTNNKQVLIFFHMTHCGYCKRMEHKTFQDKKVKQLINNNFIFIDINIDNDEKIIFNNNIYSKNDFAHHLDVDFFPTVVFFDENADITYTARGYRKVEKFQKILEYIDTKSFETIDFFDYYKKDKE